MFTVADMEMEQELTRPYAYVARMHGITHSSGFSIINLKDLSKVTLLYSYRIQQPDLHVGYGGMQNKYFKYRGRYYDVQSFQFAQGGPDADLGAILFDVTELPDTTKIKEVGRIRVPDAPGGFHNVYTYKHSDGRVLMFSTVQAPYANIYDMGKLLAGDPNQGLIGKIPNPSGSSLRGYHDFYVAYDPATHQDKFYGPGAGGYYVYDVTQPDSPNLITSITGAAGVGNGHTFTPDPTGRYAVAETEYQYAPLRIFDLKPGLDGTVKTISRPIGAWTARWQGLPHNHEVRWPYVFVSAYEDGFWAFNMMDPTNPYTVGYYYTYDGPFKRGWNGPTDPEGIGALMDAGLPLPAGAGSGISSGAFGVEVRNADGLIAISDMNTGFWAFKMDGFDGWNGHQWGMPNISSVQDWDNGPDGATPKRVS
jgi:hypothetical protein